MSVHSMNAVKTELSQIKARKIAGEESVTFYSIKNSERVYYKRVLETQCFSSEPNVIVLPPILISYQLT